MGLFDRLRSRTRGGAGAGPRAGSDRRHLEDWVRQRRGVEAFVEPRTSLNRASVLLVAHDGEWTRRAVPNEAVAFEWARGLGIPCYEASLVGYPRRMQQWRPGTSAADPSLD